MATAADATSGAEVHSKLLQQVLEHTGIHREHLAASATFGEAIRKNLKLREGVEKNDWIAAKTVVLFEELVRLVNLIEDDTCTASCCPKMSAGKHVTYRWKDNKTGESKDLPAIEYMHKLVEWAHGILSNGHTLPLYGEPFPEHFLPRMKNLHRRLFRVWAHVYLHHFATFQANEGEKKLNFGFRHWLFFVREFDLVTLLDMAPLSQLIAKFEAPADAAEPAAAGA